MKLATYRALSDGRKLFCTPILQERLTFAAFKQIHGGGFAELPPNHEAPPVGYSLWKTARGHHFAIRDEG